jgi:hypothetical protein
LWQQGTPQEGVGDCWVGKAMVLRINTPYNYPNERRNQRRTQKTLLIACDRNRSMSGPTVYYYYYYYYYIITQFNNYLFIFYVHLKDSVYLFVEILQSFGAWGGVVVKALRYWYIVGPGVA